MSTMARKDGKEGALHYFDLPGDDTVSIFSSLLSLGTSRETGCVNVYSEKNVYRNLRFIYAKQAYQISLIIPQRKGYIMH